MSNKKNITPIILALSVAMLLPLLASAITFSNTPATNGITSIPWLISSVVSIVWQGFAGLAVVMFIIAGAQFLLAEGDPEKLRTARRFIIWGVVGVAVAILGYSIVTVVSEQLKPGKKGDPCTQDSDCQSNACSPTASVCK